tara:strand:- start:14412 stop:14870 length:459 start_codon:yes stop_codon:yes gene_type:complete
MSEKKTIKIKTRKTARNKHYKTKFISKSVTNIVNLIETIITRNRLNSDVILEIFRKIRENIDLFTEQFQKIGEKKISFIENDMAKIKYNRKTDIKSTLFGYIELLNDFGIYLNKEKYKTILNTRDTINDNLHHFIMLLNDSTFHEDQVKRFV